MIFHSFPFFSISFPMFQTKPKRKEYQNSVKLLGKQTWNAQGHMCGRKPVSCLCSLLGVSNLRQYPMIFCMQCQLSSPSSPLLLLGNNIPWPWCYPKSVLDNNNIPVAHKACRKTQLHNLSDTLISLFIFVNVWMWIREVPNQKMNKQMFCFVFELGS